MSAPGQTVARIQNLATRLLRQARLMEDGSTLTSAQYSALSTINSHAGLSLTRLARLEQVSHPTMSRTIRALAQRGLVQSTQSGADRRTSQLSLTEAGEDAYRAVYARRLVVIEQLLSRLRPETVADILAAMEELAPSAEP